MCVPSCLNRLTYDHYICYGARPSNFWCETVDVRGLALPSAAKSNNCKFGAKKSHYQSKVFVCVSVTSGRMRIIAQIRSIGFYEAMPIVISLSWKLQNLKKKPVLAYITVLPLPSMWCYPRNFFSQQFLIII